MALTTTTRRLALSEAEIALVCSLYQHRVCSTSQLHAMHTSHASLRWARKLLARLHQAGMVDRVADRSQARESLWFVTELGAEVVEAAAVVPARAYRMTPELAMGPLQAHTLRVNDVGLAFMAAAEARGHECGPLAWQHEVAHRLGERGAKQRGSAVIADALLWYTVREPGQEDVVYRFVELDRATMPVQQLAAKLRAYAHLHELGGPVRGKLRDLPRESWRHHYPVWPGVMVVLCGASPSSLRHRMQTLCRLYQADPLLARAEGLKATLTTLAELQQRGPFEPIFTRAEGGGPVDLLGRSRDRARSDQLHLQGQAAAQPRGPAPRTS